MENTLRNELEDILAFGPDWMFGRLEKALALSLAESLKRTPLADMIESAVIQALEPQVTHRFEEAVRKAVEAGVSAGFETLQRDLESSNLGEYDMKTLVARMDDRIGRMERKMSLVLLKLQSVGEIDSADWWKLGSDDCEGEEEEPGEGG